MKLDDLRPAMTDVAAAALDLAARGGHRPIDTRDVLLALAVLDARAEWDRLWLEFGAPDDLATAAVTDAHPAGHDEWRGVPCTDSCATAIRAAGLLAGELDELPVPPGLLSLCLVADPDSAASRALTHDCRDRQAKLIELGQEVFIEGAIAGAGGLLRHVLEVAAEATDDEIEDDVDAERLAEEIGEFLAQQTADGPSLRDTLRAALERQQVARPGDADDLKEVAEAWQRMLGHPEFADAAPEVQLEGFGGAGYAHGRSYQSTGSPRSLDAAIASLTQFTDRAPDDDGRLPDVLNQLGLLHIRRMRRPAGGADLDAAIRAFSRAVEAGGLGWPGRLGVLSNLGNAYCDRYELGGAASDLRAAAAIHRKVIDAARPDDPERNRYHANLSVTLMQLYNDEGRLTDLEESVHAGRAGVAATPKKDPNLARYLSALANALSLRHERLGAVSDLADAIDQRRAALAAAPPNEPDLPTMRSSLGIDLATHFQRHGDDGAIDAAVAAHRSALGGIPPHDPNRPGLLTNLANALLLRLRRAKTDTVDPADANEAVELGEEALRLIGPRHPARAATVAANLAEALRTRFDRSGHRTDLDRAIEHGRAAIAGVPDDNADRSSYLCSLGENLAHRAALGAGAADLADAVDRWREAIESDATPSWARVRAARALGDTLADAGDAEAALAGYTTAVSLLPNLSWRGLDRAGQEWQLARFGGLTCDSAATALAVGRADRALELLERGRSVLWSQILHTRRDLTDLRAADADLADQLDSVRALLVLASDTDTLDDRMVLARKWDTLADQVRGLGNEFRDFDHTPDAEALRKCATRDPIVVVNISRWRCDALIVKDSGIEVVELPELRQDDVFAEAQAYLNAVGARQGDAERGAVSRDADAIGTADAVEAALDRCLRWMWNGFAAKILEHLGYTTTPTGDWPRVWWCPTGPLTLLPIHAAGDHRTPGQAVLDRVISSYTPTLRALVEARGDAGQQAAGSQRMLFVGMPQTPGQADLPNVRKEDDLITGLFGQRRTPLVGARASRETVLAGLLDHSWVHFACHGEQNLDNPSQGGVLVQDGALTVTDLSSQQYQGDFAYLSGCKTAVGGTSLPDEAITLAAALHYTGYRHVIATLWSVWDAEAAQLARDVYEAAAPNGVLHADEAASALHHAVRKLRAARPDRPSVWTPFAHTGP